MGSRKSALGIAVALFVAGCGGSTAVRFDQTAVRSLIALAHRIPREGACAQARDIRALQQRAIALVNAGRVPAALQEPLLSGANALSAQTPACLPAVTPAPPPPPPDQGMGKGKGPGHDKHEDEG